MIQKVFAQTAQTPDVQTTSQSVGVAQNPQSPVMNQPQSPGIMNMFILFAPMFIVIYFFIIRPQNKKLKEHQKLIESIKPGDEVITNAGIFGKVVAVNDKILTLEIAKDVKIKMLKSQVSVVNPGLQKEATSA
jgi:preprotein translocase subunit YajC